MRLGKVDFPEVVVAAARSRELVVFAGAGVSMGKPAALPGFRELVKEIAGLAGESELVVKKMLDGPGSINPDVYLGRLKGQGTDVRELAAEILSDVRPSRLHRVLLSFYPEPSAVRVVTTNFDRLFEQAAEDTFSQPVSKIYSFPELPASSDFRGIVHVHGDVADPGKMVLTDEDFGKAYVHSDAHAKKFVERLLTKNTLLFVGYSGDDVFFHYLARASSAAGSRQHFAMARSEEEQAWRKRGIQPIPYPESPSNDDFDDVLCESLSRLAEHAVASAAEQRSRIGKLASKVPSELNREETDLVADALSDTVRRKFFIRAASSPEWIFWLDDRKYLASLFGSKDLSESDLELAGWLAQNFMHRDVEKLFALIGRHGTRLHADFWKRLLLQVCRPAESSNGSNHLERWISLLLSAAPRRTHRFYLFLLGQRCIEAGLTDNVAEIFEILAAGFLRLGELPSLYRTVERADFNIVAEFSPASEPHELGDLWQKGLQPKLPRIAGRFLPVLVENLAKQHRALLAWGNASQSLDQASFRRRAIEPHDQNHHPDAADAVIDATRDCLQWLAEHDRDTALHWCERLADEQAPLLRRLAMHTLTELPDIPSFGPDEKIDWLLSRGAVKDDAARHEIFRFMRLAYPRASWLRRKAVIDAILDLSPDEKESDGDGVAYARFRFNWLYWLHHSATDCDLASKALKQIRTEYPDFQPREYPDFISWSRTAGMAQRVESPSPWPASQLLAEPAGRWVSRLLEYCPKGSPFEGTPWERRGLQEQVAEAAKKNFGWGVDLADEFVKRKKWDTDLWEPLLQVWAEVDEDKIMARRVLRYLYDNELRSEHPAAIATVLYAWAESGRHAKLLNDAERIAAELWSVLSWDDEDLIRTSDFPDWWTTAINRSPGILAQFWLERFYVSGLHSECRAALETIVRDPSGLGRLGRTVLACDFSVLLQKEEIWAQENLLPFFELHEDKDAEDCQAVWEGFLHYPRMDAQTFSLMKNAFHAAVEQLHGKRFLLTEGLYARFLAVCAGVAMDRSCIPDPLEKWLPHVLRNCRVRDKGIFVSKIRDFLEEMSEQERKESWHHWLKKYWRRRRQGAVAGSLTRAETKGMFHWLPLLRDTEFKEAIDLAVRTTPAPDLQHSFLLRELDEAGLCREQPEAMVKFLLYLGRAEVTGYEWSEEDGEMIRRLRASEIPSALKDELGNLMALHDIPAVKEGAA